MSSDIKTVDLTVAIPPRKFGQETRAIKEKLDRLISQYVCEADGVLIKWSDLDILTDKGIIIDDQPYSFWKVRFTAHVFKPIEGKLVKGKVHKIFKHYFIVKAMESFVVTVAIPEAFTDHKIVQNLMVDQEVYFRIIGSLDGAYQGELDEECIKLTKKLVEQQMELDVEKNVYDYAKDFEY